MITKTITSKGGNASDNEDDDDAAGTTPVTGPSGDRENF